MADDETPESVSCPVCEANVPMNAIQKHVDECLNKSDENVNPATRTTPTTTKKNKRTTPTGIGSGSATGRKRTLKTVSPAGSSSKQPRTISTSPATVCIPSTKTTTAVPLYETVRPTNLEEFVGQEDVTGKGSVIGRIVETGAVPSLILWGPPGCGKTTLARLVASSGKSKSNMRFVQLSATTSGIADIKEVVKIAKNDKKMFRNGTVLFIDEIHRFNKLQQDSFLPHIEDGTITLLGATTENPSFSLNSALLSRCHVIVLHKLTINHIQSILWRTTKTIGIAEYSAQDGSIQPTQQYIDPKAVSFLADYSDGDARAAINALHLAAQLKNSSESSGSSATNIISIDDVKMSLQRNHLLYDKSGDEHYNLISALIKSMRGSDPSASLYWLARMLTAGEDPLYIARRVVVFASEDIGLADPLALNQAVAAFHACHSIGMPECELNLSQAVIYMARASKSRDVFDAYHRAKKAVSSQKGPLPSVPLHLRNAPTKLMKDLGYGRKNTDNTFLPPELSQGDFFND